MQLSESLQFVVLLCSLTKVLISLTRTANVSQLVCTGRRGIIIILLSYPQQHEEDSEQVEGEDYSSVGGIDSEEVCCVARRTLLLYTSYNISGILSIILMWHRSHIFSVSRVFTWLIHSLQCYAYSISRVNKRHKRKQNWRQTNVTWETYLKNNF